MSIASSAQKSVQFPVIHQDTISRLSAEAGDRMTRKALLTEQPKLSWFAAMRQSPILDVSWPFK